MPSTSSWLVPSATRPPFPHPCLLAHLFLPVPLLRRLVRTTMDYGHGDVWFFSSEFCIEIDGGGCILPPLLKIANVLPLKVDWWSRRSLCSFQPADRCLCSCSLPRLYNPRSCDRSKPKSQFVDLNSTLVPPVWEITGVHPSRVNRSSRRSRCPFQPVACCPCSCSLSRSHNLRSCDNFKLQLPKLNLGTYFRSYQRSTL